MPGSEVDVEHGDRDDRGDVGAIDADRLRRVIEVGRGVLSELDPEALLDRVLETAREITGARYAALGVLDESRCGSSGFLCVGSSSTIRTRSGRCPAAAAFSAN